MLTATLLITSTSLSGSLHCAAAADNRKLEQLQSKNGSDSTTTAVSGSGRWRFVVSGDHVCDAVVDDDGVTSFPVYVVVVQSRPGQRGRMQRDAVRATWGSPLHRRVAEPADTRLAFVLGRDAECDRTGSWCAEALRRESRLYADLVVGDFADAYRRLSVKSLHALAWARRHCRSARYVVKVDDDVYVRAELLPRVPALSADSAPGPAVIVGSLNVNSSVQRRGPWRVTERQFPAPRFPPYCSGNVYAMPSSVADRLLAAAETDFATSAPPFPLEDVYVTALLASAVGARCVNDDAFPRWDVGPSRANVERLRTGSLLAVHNVHYTQMYDVMRQLNDDHDDRR